MKWTGHSDYKAMKPYIDIADDVKAYAINKFNPTIKNNHQVSWKACNLAYLCDFQYIQQ